MWIKPLSHAILASRKNVLCLSWAEFVVILFLLISEGGLFLEKESSYVVMESFNLPHSCLGVSNTRITEVCYQLAQGFYFYFHRTFV